MDFGFACQHDGAQISYCKVLEQLGHASERSDLGSVIAQDDGIDVRQELGPRKSLARPVEQHGCVDLEDFDCALFLVDDANGGMRSDLFGKHMRFREAKLAQSFLDDGGFAGASMSDDSNDEACM